MFAEEMAKLKRDVCLAFCPEIVLCIAAGSCFVGLVAMAFGIVAGA